jgi:hypothetical protein
LLTEDAIFTGRENMCATGAIRVGISLLRQITFDEHCQPRS